MPGNRPPRISVLVPALNAEEYLAATFDTVLAQTYAGWEMVCVHGRSSDRTGALLREYSKRDPRIRVFSRETESAYDAIWQAAREARGEFFYVLACSDGYLEKRWFEYCLREMDADPEISLVWGIPFSLRSDGKLVPHYIYAHFLEKKAVAGGGLGLLERLGKLLKDPRSWPRLPWKINWTNLNLVWHLLRREAVPQKREWFRYWLKTGTIFPDGNSAVARKAFLECMPPYVPGSREPGDWMGFYYNFNSRGYLARCIPIAANFGRTHAGQLGEVVSVYNDRNRAEYWRKLKLLRHDLRQARKEFHFVDRNGKPLAGK